MPGKPIREMSALPTPAGLCQRKQGPGGLEWGELLLVDAGSWTIRAGKGGTVP